MESITPSVPRMVSSPVNSWVKPISKPSLNCSTSVVMRLMASPGRWASIYFSGSTSRWPNALTRMSRTTWNVMRLLTTFISHWASDVQAIVAAMATASLATPAKSTCPGPRIRSTALPEMTGASSVVTTVTTASVSVRATSPAYGRIRASTRRTVERREKVLLCTWLIAFWPPPLCSAGSGRSHGRPGSCAAARRGGRRPPARRRPAPGYGRRAARWPRAARR